MKPVSKSKNPGLAKMAKSAKGKEAIKKMGYNPNRMVAKKGGRAMYAGGGNVGFEEKVIETGKMPKKQPTAQIAGFGKARRR
jgi:hypothetical protein